MAYTFDEVLANQPPSDPNEFDEAQATIVITQEDGRADSLGSWRMSNNAINTDGKKRSSFVALLFAAGYGKRWAATVDG